MLEGVNKSMVKISPFFILAIVIIVLAAILYVFLNLNAVYLEEIQSIPTISGFYTFSVGLFIPVGIVLKVGFNFRAVRAINPVTKRFIPASIAVIGIVLLGLLWYFILLPLLNRYFANFLISNLTHTLSSVLWFPIWTIFLAALSIIIFAALAVPGKLKTALRFVIRW